MLELPSHAVCVDPNSDKTMADDRLGDSHTTEEERRKRDTWINRRQARAAGWSDEEWDHFVETGNMPLGPEEPYEKESGPIY